jgi:drug/metabolite transporter (DMT)-like permease
MRGSVPEPDLSTEAAQATAARLRAKRTYGLLALLLVLRPFGNLCLAWGMKHFSQVLSINPLAYISAMLNPYVALGVGMLIMALLMRMALLSLADLSFVLPLTATGYIISTLLGRFFLSEEVSSGRWLGTLLIFAGTVIVGSTSHTTTRQMEAKK